LLSIISLMLDNLLFHRQVHGCAIALHSTTKTCEYAEAELNLWKKW